MIKEKLSLVKEIIYRKQKAFIYSDEFLMKFLSKLKELKKINLSNDKNIENSLQIKSILGKSFEDEEFKSILNSNDENFIEKLNKNI